MATVFTGREVIGALDSTSRSWQESHNTSKGPEATWRLSKVQFVYDSSEKTHFKDAVSGECCAAGFSRGAQNPRVIPLGLAVHLGLGF